MDKSYYERELIDTTMRLNSIMTGTKYTLRITRNNVSIALHYANMKDVKQALRYMLDNGFITSVSDKVKAYNAHKHTLVNTLDDDYAVVFTAYKVY